MRHNDLAPDKEVWMADSNSNSGIIAMLVVIVMLLIGGFLYTQMRDDGPTEIEIELPDAEIGR